MTLLESPIEHRLVRAAARLDLAAIDRDREIQAAADAMTQSALARVVHLTQPRVNQIVKRTRRSRPGFSGATPREIALRFAADELTEAQAIDELGRWEYEEAPEVDPYDGLWVPGPGTWLEVVDALDDGLITEDIYEGAQQLRRGLTKAG